MTRLRRGLASRGRLIALAVCVLIAGALFAVLTSNDTEHALPDAIRLDADRVQSGDTRRMLVFGTDGAVSVLSATSSTSMGWSVFAPDGTKHELPSSHPPLADFVTAALYTTDASDIYGLHAPTTNMILYDRDSRMPGLSGLYLRMCEVREADIVREGQGFAQGTGSCGLIGVRTLASLPVRLNDGTLGVISPTHAAGGGRVRAIALSATTQSPARAIEAEASPTIAGSVHLLGWAPDPAPEPVFWDGAASTLFVGSTAVQVPKSVRPTGQPAYLDGALFAIDAQLRRVLRIPTDGSPPASVQLTDEMFPAGSPSPSVFAARGWVVVYARSSTLALPTGLFDRPAGSTPPVDVWWY